MKKIILGIILGLVLSIGSFSLAQTQIKLVMVPEYINGYKTVDLLAYVARLKGIADAKTNKAVQNQPRIEELQKMIDAIQEDWGTISANDKSYCMWNSHWKTMSACAKDKDIYNEVVNLLPQYQLELSQLQNN